MRSAPHQGHLQTQGLLTRTGHCGYDWIYQWSTTQCEPGDANYQAVCETYAPTSQPTTPSPTPEPTLAPTDAPVVAGALTLSGISVEEVTEEAEAVIRDAIAQVAGVTQDAVTILNVASARRRRLQTGVVVDYKIESTDLATSEDAADQLQNAADDP